jgi:hypothetical protein
MVKRNLKVNNDNDLNTEGLVVIENKIFVNLLKLTTRIAFQIQ